MVFILLLLLFFSIEEGRACIAMKPGELPCPTVPQTTPPPVTTALVKYSELIREMNMNGDVVYTCKYGMQRAGEDSSIPTRSLVCVPDSGFFVVKEVDGDNGVKVKDRDTFHCTEPNCSCHTADIVCPIAEVCYPPIQKTPCVFKCPSKTYPLYKTKNNEWGEFDPEQKLECVGNEIPGVGDWERGLICALVPFTSEPTQQPPLNTGCKKLLETNYNNPGTGSSVPGDNGLLRYFTGLEDEVFAYCSTGVLYVPSSRPGDLAYFTCKDGKWPQDEATCLPDEYGVQDCLKIFVNGDDVEWLCNFGECVMFCKDANKKFINKLEDGTTKERYAVYCAAGKLVTGDLDVIAQGMCQ